MRRVLALVACLGAVALNGEAQAPRLMSLGGRVIAADTNLPLANVCISLIVAATAVAPTCTGTDGTFAIVDIPSGAYRLTATKAGYLTAKADAAAISGDVTLRMTRAAVITGRVLDTRGDPIPDGVVIAERQGVTIAMSGTDDRGEYRLFGLDAGSFRVRAELRPRVFNIDGTIAEEFVDFLDVRQAAAAVRTRAPALKVFYPSGRREADAQLVTVAAGDVRTAMDIISEPLGPETRVVPDRSSPSIVDLRELPGRNTGTGTIRGRVLFADGRPALGASVRLSGDRGTPPAFVDDEGRFAFLGIGAGTYQIFGSHVGFASTEHGQQQPGGSGDPVRLESGETRNNVDVVLAKLSALAGHVVDENGEPVAGAGVRVHRIEFRQGRRRLIDAPGGGTHQTDDRGAYRIYDLLPGDYVVSAAVNQVIDRKATSVLPGYATTYYPGTTSANGASRVRVDVADEILSVDFGLVMSSAVHVSGTVLGLSDSPVRVSLTPSVRSGSLVADAMSVRAGNDGFFDFSGVPQGEYVLRAFDGGEGPDDEGEFASQFVTVGNTDVGGLRLGLTHGSSIRGRLTLEGQAAAASVLGIGLRAVPIDEDRSPVMADGPATALVQTNRTFAMTGLAGPRLLRIDGGPMDVMLKAVLVGGRDVTDTPLMFGREDQSVADVEIVLTDRATAVIGRVQDARNRSVGHATVVAFSTDASKWGIGSRFMAAAVSTSDGRFRLRNLPPGGYYVAAVTAIAPDEWCDPDLLGALAARAMQIILQEGESLDVVLPPSPRPDN